MSLPLVLIGGGGHAKVVFDAAIAAGLTVEGFLDDSADAALSSLGVRNLGLIRDWANWTGAHGARFMPAIGDNDTRCALMLGILEGGDPAAMAVVIHPSAVISRHDVAIGRGTFIGPRAIVNPGSRIGMGAIINSGAIVEHDACIGDWVHIGPGAVLGGAVTVESRTLVGLGSRVLPERHIGEAAVVGAGAVVTRDVPDRTTVRGNPARES